MSVSADIIVKKLKKNLAVYVYDELDSTNNEAKRRGIAPALYVADSQTAGRGRRGHSFYSPKGTGLYFTLSLPLSAEPQRMQKITCAAAVAVCEAIGALSERRPMIKWVNDIYLSNRKVCGILTEMLLDEKNRPTGVIVGVGVNLTTAHFPDQIREIAGSIGEIDPNLLCAQIVNRLTDIDAILNDNSLIEKYKALNLCIGREISYTDRDGIHRATAVGVEEDGGLIAEEDGTRRTLRSGEISVTLT